MGKKPQGPSNKLLLHCLSCRSMPRLASALVACAAAFYTLCIFYIDIK
jgi:hypothetical protein